jgi:acetyltransferase-like isoleucine patch superfamily enzyme
MHISRIINLTKKRIRDIITNPRLGFIVGVALLKGCFYIVKYNLFYKNVKIKFPLRAYAQVKIIGSGSVFIDKGCSVYINVFQGLTIVTLSDDAKVFIGKGCALGGVTIRCHHKVVIGDRTMTAYSLVQDTFFLNSDKVKSYNINKVLTKESIAVGENVWLGGQSIILGGCTIGKDSVLSLGSLCYHNKIGDYCFANYSPVRRALPIDKLLKLKG